MSWNFLTDTIPDGALLLDCRSDGPYAKSTLKGALGASYIKKPFGSGPVSLGRLSGFLELIRARADKHSSILVFDEGQGMYAGRMAFLLEAAGIGPVFIYSRRLENVEAGLLAPGKETLVSEPLEKPLPLQGIVAMSHVQVNLTKVQLVDVRTPEEHDGLVPRMVQPEVGSVCGKIPGSMNYDWRRLYDAKGAIRPRGEVGGDVRSIGLIPERPTILYDFNGARSCTVGLVLKRLGYRQVQVYLGSWMEWRKSTLPKQNVRTWKG